MKDLPHHNCLQSTAPTSSCKFQPNYTDLYQSYGFDPTFKQIIWLNCYYTSIYVVHYTQQHLTKKNELSPGDDVFVYLEKTSWDGPYTLLFFEELLAILLDQSGYEHLFYSTMLNPDITPYLPNKDLLSTTTTKENCFYIYLAQILQDPFSPTFKISKNLMVLYKKDVQSHLIERNHNVILTLSVIDSYCTSNILT